MAQQQNLMDQKKLCCSICLDLLKDPVTIPCGHSYCMNCVRSHWDEEGQKKICTFMSCLQCLVSYCEQHLRPHYESPAFEKHKLVDPSKKLQENVCPHHGKVMKIFCRTDQQCICYLCSMDDHKDHHTVLASAERTERQGELGTSRQKIQRRIQEREDDVKLLQAKVEAVDRAADLAVKNSDKIFTQLVRLIKNRSSDVKQQIRSKQKNEVSPAKELQEKLQQEITELRRKEAELEHLSHIEDHIHFLNNYPSLRWLRRDLTLPFSSANLAEEQV
uniref:B box-type domain-containing protein n=1 Tax=Sparus aurata TaxID=8175 RepID=A0A671VNJ8_SPAAU